MSSSGFFRVFSVFFFLIPVRAEAQDIDFGDVAPLFKTHCTYCHQPGQMGPMPLTNYEEIRSYGQMIKYVIQAEYMPPGLPDADYGAHKNRRKLPDSEKKQILAWVDAGMPPSQDEQTHNLSLSPVVPTPKAQQVFCMDTVFEQYSVYMPQFQVFVIPTSFRQGVFAHNIRFHPGNSTIVRSCRISVSTDDKWQKLDDWDPRYGYYSFGGPGAIPEYESWYEWQPFNVDESDSRRLRYLPPQSYFIVEMHYGPTGTKQWDQSCLSFDTIHQPTQLQVQSAPLVSRLTARGIFETLPANQQTRVHSSFTLPFDMSITALSPTAHLLCRNWEIYAKTPEGNIKKLLKISDWQKMWQEKYYLQRPLHLKAGTEIRALATYDNSSNNPYQPADPPIAIPWGHGMYEEQFKVTFDYIKTQVSDSANLRTPSQLVKGKPVPLSIWSTGLKQCKVSLLSLAGEGTVDEKVLSVSPGRWHHDRWEISPLPLGVYELHLSDLSGKILDRTLLFVVEEVDFFKR